MVVITGITCKASNAGNAGKACLAGNVVTMAAVDASRARPTGINLDTGTMITC